MALPLIQLKKQGNRRSGMGRWVKQCKGVRNSLTTNVDRERLVITRNILVFMWNLLNLEVKK